MQQLDPRAVWMFFLSGFIGILFFFLFSGFWLFSLFMSTGSSSFSLISMLLLILLPFSSIVFSYLYAVLTYKYYKYELRPDGFRKEHGIIWKKYVTIPYNRIQNVDIYRGLIARMLGLSDLNIQTAGSSMSTGSKFNAEGRLPGLSFEKAEEIRDKLIAYARNDGKDIGV